MNNLNIIRAALKGKLEELSVMTAFGTIILGPIISIIIFIYILKTKFWWVCCLYLIWYFFDKAPDKGGRRIELVRNFFLWRYGLNYFQTQLVTATDNMKLDSKRNYLFCSFPHGVIPAGIICHFGSNFSLDFKKIFPNHISRIVLVSKLFSIPFYRDYILACGGISSTEESLNFVLSRPRGGQVVVLTPGGAAESYYCRPGQYKIILKKRKGFIRVALQNGTPLVPVISFGEPDTFDQLEGPKLRKFQEIVKKLFGVVPVIPIGTGPLKLLHHKVKITVVVGDPIEVTKINCPSQTAIEELHQRFIKEIVNLFEEQKFKHLENPENIHLEIL